MSPTLPAGVIADTERVAGAAGGSLFQALVSDVVGMSVRAAMERLDREQWLLFADGTPKGFAAALGPTGETGSKIR